MFGFFYVLIKSIDIIMFNINSIFGYRILSFKWVFVFCGDEMVYKFLEVIVYFDILFLKVLVGWIEKKYMFKIESIDIFDISYFFFVFVFSYKIKKICFVFICILS